MVRLGWDAPSSFQACTMMWMTSPQHDEIMTSVTMVIMLPRRLMYSMNVGGGVGFSGRATWSGAASRRPSRVPRMALTPA
ncbi:hypothetical protein DMB42_02330 [Nonomuraea sp. WAC 01424]|nr:hypothetical protein DMB42_02330 [Nonomuraea sp. WAC 01424]